MAQQRIKVPRRHDFLGVDPLSIQHALANRLTFQVGKDEYTATPRDWYHTAAYVVRDRLMARWMETQRSYYRVDAKRVYYLSLEFLLGRALLNALLNLGIRDRFVEACERMGLELEEIAELEPDAALGNGGLGRLAACFLDSMATLELPAYGYGIRYEYGMFTQKLEAGRQVEHPENWLRYGNPWEFPRPEVLYPVKFYGRVVDYVDERGRRRCHWIGTEDVMAMAYDTPVPGWRTNTVNNLRLWSAKASRDFDLRYFNEGNYIKAVEAKNSSENLSRVLYPDDTTAMGRELRLKQEYFFVSASLQDILRRFLKAHDDLRRLPDKAAIQLNDTHPALAIPELMRLLLDVHGLDWDLAWDITRRTFSYTNHTLLPEALETWPVAMLEEILPRHLQIIYEINHRFLQHVVHRFPGDVDRLRRMSFIDEEGERRVRMAHLAVVGSHKVNGVARLHTQLMRETIFRDFHELEPEKFVNMTNGVTPRRWLHHANPALCRLISSRIGTAWVRDLERLRELEPHVEDPAFLREFAAAKQANKARLAELVARTAGVSLPPEALFDVQVKRIHEYKRQLLNLLHVLTLYRRIRGGMEVGVPRAVIFAGKAAPGYRMAKAIIKLINDVADVVNHDPAVGGRLRVAFVPNYNVSLAEVIIPGAELSEQISLAGTEASGTSNMKFALNGALTIGTLDGANVEIREQVGEDNVFIFGMTAEEVLERRRQGYDPWACYHGNEELRAILDMIRDGYFSPDEQDRHRPVVDALTHGGDPFMVLADYPAYVACQEQVAALYQDQAAWWRKAALNVARMGYFSSDRTIAQYAQEIWGTAPVPIELAEEDGA